MSAQTFKVTADVAAKDADAAAKALETMATAIRAGVYRAAGNLSDGSAEWNFHATRPKPAAAELVADLPAQG